MCIGGFTSSIRCGAYNACPPGLLCEQGIKFCCPMILPVDSMKTTKRPFFHNYRHNGPLALNGLQQSFNPPMMHSYGGPQGFAQYNNINYAKAPALHRYGPYAGGGADFGYRPQRCEWGARRPGPSLVLPLQQRQLRRAAQLLLLPEQPAQHVRRLHLGPVRPDERAGHGGRGGGRG